MKKQRLLPLFSLLCIAALLRAQSAAEFTIQRTLEWAAAPLEETLPSGRSLERWTFEGCTFGADAPTLPRFAERFDLNTRSRVEVEVVAVSWEAFSKKTAPEDARLGGDLTPETQVVEERKQWRGWVTFVPVRRTAGGYERVTSFTLRVRTQPELAPTGVSTRGGGPFTYTSALSTGTVYKFGVSQSTVYKLDYNFLKNTLGISNLDNVDPRTIRLFGNGGKMVPERAGDPRPDDLLENAIFVSGESDGKFDAGDFVLFYAVGPDPWVYRASNNDPELTVRKNLYDRHAWYFIRVGDGNGLRMGEQPDLAGAAATTEEFDDVRRIEDEKTNLLDFYISTQGSGKRWFGDYFNQTRSRDYAFDFPNLVTGSTARLRAEFAGRSGVNQNVRLTAEGLTLNRILGSVDVGEPESTYASLAVFQGNVKPAADKFSVKIEYPAVSEQSEGWLDYIEVNVRRRLTMAGQMMEFRDLKSLAQDVTKFRLSGANSGLTLWDVTEPYKPVRQQNTLNNNVLEFGAATKNVLRNYVAFYDNATFGRPEQVVGKLANQNLHGLDNRHMVIIYHSEFEAQAKQLAEHRRSFSGLDVEVVNVEQIFNEFGSGAKDPGAIRDFAKMLFERNPDKFEYLLLLGDGSFDPKNNTASADNKDYIPVFETHESFYPVTSYPTDDFYALLSDEEGGNINVGALDIAVGRIPARNASEMQWVIEKIIAYDKDPKTLGDWRLRSTFIGDDDENNVHLNQAEALANQVRSNQKFLNPDKIFLDAYTQVATSGGQRYPDVNQAITAAIFRGVQVMQYVGHGGPRGWAQERILTNNDIGSWENPDRYPLLITATCSFGGYDDYLNLTGGEQALLRQRAGAVGLFTTVRAVYIIDNNYLTNAVQNFIYQKTDGRYRPIGEILRVAKNSLGSGTSDNNARRFTLLGDPAMYLAMPEYSVSTTSVNGKPVAAGQPDTLRALSSVEMEAMVTDDAGNLLPSFNGRAFITIFDKAQNLQTLGQDERSLIKTFAVQRNAIFKGVATVKNGRFKFSFVVPKDINYTYGYGKISYYAEDGTPNDAAGADENIVVGGNAQAVKDDTPPLVQAFLNTDAFVSGGITDNDPKVLVKCSDDYGMNVSGTSIGHDLTAVLDGNVLETIILNEFYTSVQDDSRRGQALYPLRNLAPGKHTLKVKGWDIANNTGEGYTEFVVAEDGKAALDHVLNYPNPFTTSTNFQFGHNLAGQVLDVQVSIFTVSGKLVKTILHTAATEGYRVADIHWNGRDEYDDPLARGVYLYRVKVRGTDANGEQVTTESDFEKLVILK